jgi:hypothetical protein
LFHARYITNPHEQTSYRKQLQYFSGVKFRNAEKTQISAQSAYSLVLIQFCPERKFLNATNAQSTTQKRKLMIGL